jgi:hypothetical protein
MNFDPNNYQNALKKGCVELDEEFFNKAKSELHGDTSGSCALILIVVGNISHDSRRKVSVCEHR